MNKEFELSNGTRILVSHYMHNPDALAVLILDEGNQVEAKVTTYVDDFPYEKGDIIIKDYCENEGSEIVQKIEEILDRKICDIEVGYAVCPVYRLKDKYII